MKCFFISALCLLGMGVMQSCSSEENQMTSILSEDDFVSQVEFLTWPSSAFTKGNPTIEPNPDRGTGIISARIARKSRGCNSGFGLCDFKLFPKKKKTSVDTGVLTSTRSINEENYFEVEYDSLKNVFYANMLLATPLPEKVGGNVFPLKIDEDLYWVNDEEALKEMEDFLGGSVDEGDFQNGLLSAQAYKISAGEIPYNASLGLYGGYRVVLEPVL